MSVRVRCEGAWCILVRGHERTTTRVSLIRAANEVKVTPAPAGKVLRFDSHHRVEIGEVIDTKQPDLAVLDFVACFGRDNHRPHPGWKAKNAVRALAQKRGVIGL